MNIQEGKMPTSKSEDSYLLESIKPVEDAAAYIEAILSEKDPEPELLVLAGEM